MKSEVKALWLDALRSGKYEQGTGFLRKARDSDGDKDQYCCLGVLCDLYVKSENNVGWEAPNPYATTPAYRVDERTSYLPESVMEWAGLSSSDGEFVSDGGVRYGLAELNDEGRTFEEIAEVIQQKF